MDRNIAYATLAEELGQWRLRPYGDLVGLVGAAPSIRSVSIGTEIIDVEVRIRWAEVKPGALRIEAIANGPSCWKLERLEEAITVSESQVSGVTNA